MKESILSLNKHPKKKCSLLENWAKLIPSCVNMRQVASPQFFLVDVVVDIDRLLAGHRPGDPGWTRAACWGDGGASWTSAGCNLAQRFSRGAPGVRSPTRFTALITISRAQICWKKAFGKGIFKRISRRDQILPSWDDRLAGSRKAKIRLRTHRSLRAQHGGRVQAGWKPRRSSCFNIAECTIETILRCTVNSCDEHQKTYPLYCYSFITVHHLICGANLPHLQVLFGISR